MIPKLFFCAMDSDEYFYERLFFELDRGELFLNDAALRCSYIEKKH